ncbi:MAG: ATP-binding protein [Opitutales bacterium]
MRPDRLILCALFLLKIVVDVSAAQAYVPRSADPLTETWRFRKEEALDGFGVFCMTESKTEPGTFWFGGVSGLARYDGWTLENLEIDYAKLGIARESMLVKEIAVNKDGHLIAAIGSKVVAYKNGTWSVLIDSMKGAVLNLKLIESPDGSYWLQTHNALWHIDADLEVPTIFYKTAETDHLLSLTLDSIGDLWAIESRGDGTIQLLKFTPDQAASKARDYTEAYPLPYTEIDRFVDLEATNDNRLIICDRMGANSILIFDLSERGWSTEIRGNYKLGFNIEVSEMDGSIYAGLIGEIVRLMPDGSYHLYSQDELPVPNVALRLYLSRENRLWIMAHSNQVFSVDLSSQEWRSYEELSFQLETPSGVKWFIENKNNLVSHDTRNDVWKIYDKSETQLTTPRALIYSSHGLLWAAGNHGDCGARITVFDGQRWHILDHPDFACFFQPNSLIEAGDGTVWFGAGGKSNSQSTSGGALQYEVTEDLEFIPTFHREKGWPFYAPSMTEAADDTIWIGSTNIFSYNPSEREAKISLKNPIGNTARIVTDLTGNIWALKEHFGLYRKDAAGWSAVQESSEIFGSRLVELEVLQDNNILVGSDTGIHRFDGHSWTMNAYPQSFGMRMRTSKISENSDGSLWFSFSKGDSAHNKDTDIHPTVLRTIIHHPETNPPETEIEFYQETVAQPGNALISWSARDFQSQTKRKDLQFSWKLNDQPWSAYSKEPNHSFLDLPHGEYQLQVRSRDLAFNVDPSPAIIDFYVEPPLWLKPWFISISLGIIVSIISMFVIWFHFKNQRLRDRARHIREMSELKSSYYSNLSHELLTPLTAIIGPLEHLQSIENSEAKKPFLSIIRNGVDHISGLIDQLLNFHKLEQGQLALELSDGDFAEIVREVIELVTPIIKQHQLTCELNITGNTQGQVDAIKLRMIVSNLIHNAIKYNQAGGHIQIALLAPEGLASANPRIKIVVEDNGVGVPQESLPLLFERFYRSNSAPISEGSGIGLHLTKDLVDLWGGHIYAESPIHTSTSCPGTRFTVELPVN